MIDSGVVGTWAAGFGNGSMTTIGIDGGRYERHGGGKAFRRIGRRRQGVPQRGLVLDDDAVPGPIVAVSPQGKAALPVGKRHVLLGKIKALHGVTPFEEQ